MTTPDTNKNGVRPRPSGEVTTVLSLESGSESRDRAALFSAAAPTKGMNNVAEFIEVRQQIELLAKEIETYIVRKAMAQSKARLDEATELLTKLTVMADNDVQEIAVVRLTKVLAKLGTKVGTPDVKKRPIS